MNEFYYPRTIGLLMGFLCWFLCFSIVDFGFFTLVGRKMERNYEVATQILYGKCEKKSFFEIRKPTNLEIKELEERYHGDYRGLIKTVETAYNCFLWVANILMILWGRSVCVRSKASRFWFFIGYILGVIML